MAEDFTAVLAREFAAEEGTFLLQLRGEMRWDKAAFTRLVEAMLACCRAYDEGETTQLAMWGASGERKRLPRWLAEGFWYSSWFVRDWTTHPAWRERTAWEQDYYDAAYERLHALADWFFSGQCPYSDQAKGFAQL